VRRVLLDTNISIDWINDRQHEDVLDALGERADYRLAHREATRREAIAQEVEPLLRPADEGLVRVLVQFQAAERLVPRLHRHFRHSFQRVGARTSTSSM